MHRIKSIFVIMPILLILVSCVGTDDYEGQRPNEKMRFVGPFDASVDDGGDVAPQPQVECESQGPYDFNRDHSPYFGGDVSVDVQVDHYSSLYCIHCAEFSKHTASLWESRPEFRDRARIYFHHADFVFRHRAAVAAQNQGMENFWKLQDFIYSKMLLNDSPSDETVMAYVEKTLKLDMKKFNRDLNSDETYAFLDWEIQNAIDVNLQATPTAYFCGKSIYRWWDLELAVDEQL